MDENIKEKESEIVVENKEGETSSIKIADDVVSVIAGKAVSEAPGVYAMAGGFAGGISEVLSGKKNLSKGIKVEVGEKEAKIDVNIIVEYGSRIPDVAFDIQNRVKAAVEGMTGLKVVAVNVHVQGVNTESVTDSEEEKEELLEVIMKAIDKIILCVFSTLILLGVVLSSCLIFGWLDLTSIYVIALNVITNQTICNVLIGINVFLLICSIKGIFFISKTKEEKLSEGILLQNEDGKLLITKETITSIVNSIVSGFDSVKSSKTYIDMDENNDLSVSLTIEVDENAVIKELSNNIQIKVKDAIKKSIDVDVKSLDINVKDMVKQEENA